MWKFLFAFSWLGIFLLSLGTLFLNIYNRFVEKKIILKEIANPYFDLSIMIYAISLFYLIISIKKLFILLFRGDKKSITLKNENGSVEITYSSINNVTKTVLSNFKFVNSSRIETFMKSGKLGLKISIKAFEMNSLNLELDKMREVIVETVLNITGIRIENINLKISDIIKSNEKQHIHLEDGE